MGNQAGIIIRNVKNELFHSANRLILNEVKGIECLLMTKAFPGSISKEKFFLLLRKYQEEMLDAYLTDSDDFPELFRYCNIMYNMVPTILRGTDMFRNDRSARRLAAICVVAGGYGGDMPEDQFEELLDDMDFYHNRVKCIKIERLVPTLNKLVEEELRLMQ